MLRQSLLNSGASHNGIAVGVGGLSDIDRNRIPGGGLSVIDRNRNPSGRTLFVNEQSMTIPFVENPIVTPVIHYLPPLEQPTTLPLEPKPEVRPLPDSDSSSRFTPLPSATTLPSDSSILNESNIPYEPTGKGNALLGSDPNSWTPSRFEIETLGGSVPSVASSLIPALAVVGVVLVMLMTQRK